MKKQLLLSKQESKEICGGTSAAPAHDGGDNVNKNVVATCSCTWKDHSATINENTVTGCLCKCLHTAK